MARKNVKHKVLQGMRLGASVRKYRKIRQMTQAELAKRVGCTVKTVNNIECERVFPELKQVVALCGALNVAIEDLIGVSAHTSCDKFSSKKRCLTEISAMSEENCLLLLNFLHLFK